MHAQVRPFRRKLAALILPLLAALALAVWAITAGTAISRAESRQQPAGTDAAGQTLRRPAIVTSVDKPDAFKSALP